VICGGDTVSIYAVDLLEADRLIENLRVFSSYLPVEVMQIGKYTESFSSSQRKCSLSAGRIAAGSPQIVYT
jgi:hypothetical protein